MENKFKAGDTVRIHNRGCSDREWVGTEGKVVSTGNFGLVEITLTKATAARWSAGQTAQISPENLELVEFKYADIEEGDKIRRTRTYPNGALEIREGVAESKGSYYWASGNYILSYEEDDTNPVVVLELLERPEKPKHWSEEKPVGSVGVRNSDHGPSYSKVFRKTGKDQWQVDYIVSGIRNTVTSEQLIKQFSRISEDDIDWVK